MKTFRLSIALLFLIVGLTAHASDGSYNFNVESAKTADSVTGNVINASGAGQFNVNTGAVRGTGAFSVSNSAGAVLARGTWRATELVDFVSLGGENRGLQNGILHINVTLFPTGGAPVNVLLGVVCPPNEGPGEGITLIAPGASFNVPISGFTTFSLK